MDRKQKQSHDLVMCRPNELDQREAEYAESQFSVLAIVEMQSIRKRQPNKFCLGIFVICAF